MNGLRYEVGFGLVEKLLCSSFQRYMIHIPKNSFYKFRKLGHMTDDVIIGSRDQNWSNFFSPKFTQIDFRKSRGGIRPHYKGLLHAIRKFSRGVRWTPYVGLKLKVT